MTHMARLPSRGVIALSGPDRVGFLQGLVSNDVTQAAPGRAVWAALLSPQGKWLADFFVLSEGDELLLDCEAAHVPMLLEKLTRYRLRAAVALADLSQSLHGHAAWGSAPELPPGAIAAPDPRLPEAGWRVLSSVPAEDDAGEDAWDTHRLTLGLPDGSRDLESGRTVLLEAGFDELGGISWNKGCYMGQELTARTKYRGLVKRRLMPVVFAAAAAPPPETPVLDEVGAEVGQMRSSRDALGMAVLRLDALGGRLICGGHALATRHLEWMRLPEPADGGA